MKRILRLLFYTICLLAVCESVYAQTPAAGTVNFTTTPPAVNQTSATGVVTYVPTGTSLANGGQGLEFVIEGTAAANLQILSNTTNSNNLTFSRTASQTIQRVRVRSAAYNSATSTSTTLNTPGWQFNIGSIKVALVTSAATTLTFQGFKNGVSAGSQTFNFTAAMGTAFQTITFSTAFDDVDDIVITGSMGNGIRLDDIFISPTVNYSTPQNYSVGTAITSLSPNSNGGTVAYTVSPTLPAGLILNGTTGVISGTPTTVTAAANYTVTGTYTGGTSTSVIRIAVVPVGPATPADINTATNTIPENSAIGTVVGLTAYSSTTSAGATNLALNKTATATSYENATTLAANFAVDGDATGSRWGSAFLNDQDFTVDLGAVYDISRVKITWEAAYGTDYQIQVSTDNSTFTTIKNIHGNTSLVNDLTNLSSSASFGRYIRMHGIDRATQYGFSMYEFEVYGATVTYSFTAGGNPGSLFAINSATGIVTVANATIDYEAGTTRTVTIQASDGTNTSSQSFVIAITDVNETPDITSNGGAATASIPVAEGSTAVTTVTATDPDAGQTLTYSISGTNASLFTINSSTGVLTFNAAAITGTYTVVATATDNGSPVKNVTQTITVTVSGGSLTGYAYRLPITLQTENVSGVTGNLTNFPVLVKITNTSLAIVDGACTNKVQFPNGPNYDFAFTNASGTELNYQLESYDKTTGTLIAWVKVPTVNYQSNTVIALYFGKIVAPTNHNTAFTQATWSTVTGTSASYKGVWHFNETPSTSSSDLLDATGSGNTLLASNASVVSTASGLVQNGVTLGGGTLSKSGAANLPALNAAITMSAWVNYPTYPATAANVFVLQNSGSAIYTQMAFRGTSSAPSANASGGGVIVSSTGQPAANTWHYIVYTFDGTTNTIYVDGVASTSTTAPNTGTAVNAVFGSYIPGGTENYTGILDEARTINVAMTNSWVQMEYKNQLNPTGFCSVSTLATDPTYVVDIPGGVVYTFNGVSYSPNVAGVSTTPQFNGKESFIVTGNTTVGQTVPLYALTVSSGVTLNINGSNITVACNVVNNGTITYGSNNASTIQFIGSQPQSYTAGATTNVASVGTLVINNSAASTVTLAGGPFNVYNLLTLTSGSLASNGFLTLKSISGNTANVGPINSGAVTGNVNVERYVTGGSNLYRGYRLFSSPVYSGTVSGNKVYDLAYLKNTSYITGSTTTGGFDNTAAANPTIYLYRENTVPVTSTFITGNFRGVNKINSSPLYDLGIDIDGTKNLPIGNGFMFFFRGDRATNSTPTVTTSNATTATFTQVGLLNQGPITVQNWFTPASSLLYTTGISNTNVRGLNLVGNPYASAIDWDKFTTAPTAIPHTASVINTIYRYNVRFKAYSVYIAGGGGAATNLAGNTGNIIQSGEGFFVKTNALSATLGFTEAAKITTTQVAAANSILSTAVPAADAPLQYMRLTLIKDSVNADDALFFFKSGAKTDFVDGEDAAYLAGTGGLSLSSKSTDNLNLAINRIELPKKSQTIPLNTTATTSGLYHINLSDVTNIPLLYDVWLMDAFKKDSLDMRRHPEYNFNIDLNNTATFGSSRFSLVIRQNPAYALKLLDFKAEKSNSGAQLSWITENESNYTNFTVERSVDNGKTFEVIGGFASTNLGKYNLLDPAPVLGLNQYRLKQDDLNGAVTYSKISGLMYSNAADAVIVNNMSVFPNPTVDMVNVSVTTQSGATSYLIRITDGIGTLVKSATSTQPTWQDNVSNLKPGTYFVQVINNTTKSVVGTGKFIKR